MLLAAPSVSRRVRHGLAILCIVALFVPTLLLLPQRTRARISSPSDVAPLSAPHEAYIASGETSTSNTLTPSAWIANDWESSLKESITDAGDTDKAINASDPRNSPNSKITASGANFRSQAKTAFLSGKERSTSVALSPPSQPAAMVDFDFDGDGKSDLSRWHPGTTEFKIHNSSGGSYSTYTVGSSSAVLAPADYDGDGKTDPAFFNAGTWTIRMSSTGSTTTVTGFGQAGDIPVPGNYIGTGSSAAELAFFRPSNGNWYWRDVANSTVYSQHYGASTDIPVPGDYDGDGLLDQAVYRPTDDNWYILTSSNATSNIYWWGISTDIPVPGDFDGDGKSDITVYRPGSGTWFVLKSSTSYSAYDAYNWGYYGDQPVAGDFDGDGKADYAVWRPTTGYWWIVNSSNGGNTGEALGTIGDTAVPSTYVKQINGGITPDLLSEARSSPKNATGGTNLYSQNFGWGTNLVSLPGRAGLDLNIGISYNSLTWTKVGNAMVYNEMDGGNNGFTLDLPKIEPVYFDTTANTFTYTMVMPSGDRKGFRETAASNVFEAYDSSYWQLVTSSTNPNDPSDSISMKVTSTDGTIMDYEWIAGAYRCVKITDRNGNYITASYSGWGQLYTLTDTLGRTINLDGNGITQTWKDTNGSGSNVTHTWASYSYTTKTLNTNFDSSLAVVGPPNGTQLTVIDKITYADGSFTKFYYNDYWQIYKVENHAADSTTSSPHILNYVRTNLQSPSSNQTDCPRFTDTYNWVENFNQNGSGVAQETHVTNSVTTGQSYSLPGGLSGTGTLIQVAMASDPYNSVTKTYVSGSGWSEGLPIATEDWADGTSGTERKRWTYTAWTQDNTSAAYTINPRMTESRVGDTSNVKRTSMDYWMQSGSSTASLYGLIKDAYVYDSDLSTVLKQSYTEYNLDSAYTSRLIIGLPSMSESYGRESSGLNLMSKVTYAYDEGDFSDTSLSQNISPTQHDNTNYGSSFAYRGNLTSTTRWDATAPTNSSLAITSRVKYNTAGSPVSQTTPWDGTNTRTVRIGYADAWNDGASRTTYAYPTTITDPAGTSLGASGHSSTAVYRYDMGANAEANSPAPTGQTNGKRSVRFFDSLGRLQRNSIYIGTTEHSYVRYEYPTNGVESLAFSTIVDTDNDGADSDDEVTTESWADGAGRVRRTRIDHPGSSGGYSGVFTEYNILGQVTRTSVPTEIDSSWNPAGDDAARGFVWNSQEYDWKGRVTRTIPSDSNGTDGKDTLVSYDGCGCAGGQVTTVKGPITTAVDVSGTLQTTKRRTQKSYEDSLGRTYMAEVWDLDGGGSSPYSALVKTFNGRDQVIQSRQYAGGTSSSTYQDTIATYDGFGRAKTSHKPEQQDSSGSATSTTYNYNPDDSISSVTDARGAVTNFAYDTRGLLIGKSWTVPSGSNIVDPADVNYGYDNLGNRTSMSDGLGSITYTYDSLSELTSETRAFNDTLANAPLVGGYPRFQLTYTYNLSGQLNSLRDPYGQEIDYTQDRTGRLLTAAGTTSFGDVTNYLTDIKYRAWGTPKEQTYGNGTKAQVTFNARLQADSFNLSVTSTSTPRMQKSYQYYGDGTLKYIQDSITPKFDRLFTYDLGLRLNSVRTDAEARGQTEPAGSNVLFREDLTNNTFGQITSRSGAWKPGTSCAMTSEFGFSFTYQNNRNTGPHYRNYDKDGRLLQGDGIYNVYDADGELVQTGSGTYTVWSGIDGNDQEVKRTEQVWDDAIQDYDPPGSNYYITSTVLGGQVVSEVAQDGSKTITYVFSETGILATQEGDSAATGTVTWQIWDASGKSRTSINKNGNASNRVELDPQGNNANVICLPNPPDRGFGTLHFERSVITMVDPGEADYGENCYLYGIKMLCEQADLYASKMSDLPGFGTNWGSWAHFDLHQYSESVDNVRRGRGFHPNDYWDRSVIEGPGRDPDDLKAAPGEGPKIDPRLPTTLRNLVSNLAKKPDCADILDKFAKTLDPTGKKLDPQQPGKTFVESVFDNLKAIIVDNNQAGSGAMTDGNHIWVRDYAATQMSQAGQNAMWAQIIVRELPHDFRDGGGKFSDRQLDDAGKAILDQLKPADAAQIRGFYAGFDKPKAGELGHLVVSHFCYYTQQEREDGKTK